MKALPLLILIFHVLALCGRAQTTGDPIPEVSAKPFNLAITDWNHASLIFKGTFLYVMSETHVKVFNVPAFEQQKHLLYSKKISKLTRSVIDLSNLNLDSLNDFYVNNCIMITSGEEYSVTYKNETSHKSINLHHYYLKQIQHIIELFNENLPEKFKIKYLTQETKQDCIL